MSSTFTPAPLERAFVGFLLAIANSNPPTWGREAFYNLKVMLCEHYGHRVGHEWQHIEKECYTCYGTGRYAGVSRCYKCDGTGLYSNAWHKLEIWQIDCHRFHRPVETRYVAPNEAVTIKGRIEKDSCGKVADEANLWLCLFFDPAQWLERISKGGSYCFPGWWPMLRLQRAVAGIMSIARLLKVRPCSWCGIPFIRSSLRMHSYRCTAYRTAEAKIWEQSSGTDEIPF